MIVRAEWGEATGRVQMPLPERHRIPAEARDRGFCAPEWQNVSRSAPKYLLGEFCSKTPRKRHFDGQEGILRAIIRAYAANQANYGISLYT